MSSLLSFPDDIFAIKGWGWRGKKDKWVFLQTIFLRDGTFFMPRGHAVNCISRNYLVDSRWRGSDEVSTCRFTILIFFPHQFDHRVCGGFFPRAAWGFRASILAFPIPGRIFLPLRISSRTTPYSKMYIFSIPYSSSLVLAVFADVFTTSIIWGAFTDSVFYFRCECTSFIL